MFPDLHTHRTDALPGEAVVCIPPDVLPEEFSPQEGVSYSAGWHPQSLPSHLQEGRAALLRLLQQPSVTAIGECGIDRTVSSSPLEKQREAFLLQIELSERLQKPLILHIVHAFDLLLGLHKTVRPHMPWIVHGFRGKPATAIQLLEAGMHLSFGAHFNEESVVACPTERLFVETDANTEISRKALYDKLAALKGLPPEELANSVMQRMKALKLIR